VFDALSLDVPLRGPDGGAPRHDTVVIRLFAEALCRLDDVKANISAHGWADAKGNPRPVLDVEARLRREALEYAEALGCTPRSRSRLGLSLVKTASLAEAMSEPDPVRRAELYRQVEGFATGEGS
jgi:phage terminase small subunit